MKHDQLMGMISEVFRSRPFSICQPTVINQIPIMMNFSFFKIFKLCFETIKSETCFFQIKKLIYFILRGIIWQKIVS